MDSSKLWTRDYTIDALVNFLAYFAHYLMLVTITVYVMDYLSGTAGEAGLAYGLYIIGALFSRILTGNRIDHVGRKRSLLAGLGMFLISNLCYLAIDNIPLFMLLRFVHGLSWGIAVTSTGIIVAYLIPSERVGEGTGYYALSVTLASAFGPLLGMLLIVKVGFIVIISCSSVLTVIALILVIFLDVPETEKPVESRRRGEHSKPRLSDFLEPSAMRVSTVSFFAGFGVASVFSFLTPYVQSIDLVTAGELYFLVYAVAMVVTRPFTGRLFDRRGENVVTYPSLALFAVGLVLLSQARTSLMLLMSGILLGIGYGTYVSSTQALVIKLAPTKRMGLATSTFFGMMDFGAGISPTILGLLVSTTGYSGMYLIAALIVLGSLPLYHFLHGRNST